MTPLFIFGNTRSESSDALDLPFTTAFHLRSTNDIPGHSIPWWHFDCRWELFLRFSVLENQSSRSLPKPHSTQLLLFLHAFFRFSIVVSGPGHDAMRLLLMFP